MSGNEAQTPSTTETPGTEARKSSSSMELVAKDHCVDAAPGPSHLRLSFTIFLASLGFFFHTCIYFWAEYMKRMKLETVECPSWLIELNEMEFRAIQPLDGLLYHCARTMTDEARWVYRCWTGASAALAFAVLAALIFAPQMAFTDSIAPSATRETIVAHRHDHKRLRSHHKTWSLKGLLAGVLLTFVLNYSRPDVFFGMYWTATPLRIFWLHWYYWLALFLVQVSAAAWIMGR